MTVRAIWKGYVHFGSFDVPVRLHTAVREQRFQFHLLHSRDHVRLRQQMVCLHEKVPVPSEEQIRGFELEEGKFIIVDDKELDRIEPEDSRVIEVHEFVTAGQIDPMYLERLYYLGPDVVSPGYNALLETLLEEGLEGICTWTMRKRSYVGTLGVRGRVLRLGTLRYSDEVVPAASLDLPAIELSDRELKAGIDLVNQLSGQFQPESFENEHQKKLQELIDKKASGEKISILRPKRRKATAPDKLLETLEASLKKVV